MTVVGRKSGLCDLIVSRNSVSKLHCLLVKTDGLLFVRDLGSTNGTKVNGQRVTRGALLPGDELSLASIRFKVHLGPDKEAVESHRGVGLDESTEMINSAELAIAKMQREKPTESDVFSDDESDSDVRLIMDE